jgi:SAM-dependent methyltransferase
MTDYLGVKYKDKEYVFLKDSNTREGILKEVFLQEEYKSLDVKDKIVLDIGCGAGETAIYFSLKGAKFVFGIDINKSYLDSGKTNLENNKIENVELIQISTDIQTNLEMVTNYIRERYPNDKLVMKLDCEGGEYFYLLGSLPTTLKQYKEIIAEVHGDMQSIYARMELLGFDISVIDSKIIKIFDSDKLKAYLTMIQLRLRE